MDRGEFQDLLCRKNEPRRTRCNQRRGNPECRRCDGVNPQPCARRRGAKNGLLVNVAGGRTKRQDTRQSGICLETQRWPRRYRELISKKTKAGKRYATARCRAASRTSHSETHPLGHGYRSQRSRPAASTTLEK